MVIQPDKQTELVNAILRELNAMALFPHEQDDVSMARMRRDIISEIANPARRESVLGLFETVRLRSEAAFAHFDNALQLADEEDYSTCLSHVLDSCHALADTDRLQTYLERYEAPIMGNIATLFGKLLAAYLVLGDLAQARQLIERYGSHIEKDETVETLAHAVLQLSALPEAIREQYRIVKQALMKAVRHSGNLLSVDQIEQGAGGVLLNRILLRDTGGAGLFADVMFDPEVVQAVSPELFEHVCFSVGSVADNLTKKP